MSEQLDSGTGQLIKTLAQAAVRVEVVKPDANADACYLRRPDGTMERIALEPRPHEQEFSEPAFLCAFVKDQMDKETAAVFVSDYAVTAVYDLETRRDTAMCQLCLSPQYLALQDKGGVQMSQADMVRLLRVTFRGCLGGQDVLQRMRKLRFSASSDGTREIQHGSDSMGKSINATVAPEAQLPEEVVLLVPIYQNDPSRASVHCALEIFPDSQGFALTPYPLELRRAMDEAAERIASIFDDVVPVYRGRP